MPHNQVHRNRDAESPNLPLGSTQRHTSEEPETDNPRPRKRRSRASVACRVCRTRKTRCDNRRPTCGYCSMQGLRCDYPNSTTQDHEQDVSNNAILAKVNRAVALLEELKKTAARTSACESILNWPILAGFIHVQGAVSFALEEAACNTDKQTRQQGVIDQDGIWPLCRRFLALIHIKNPILDISDFIQHAKNAAEYGPGWDEGRCLVLLARALASVATPYDPDRAFTWQNSTIVNDSASQEDIDIGKAEAFFGAARRRLGLLTNSVVAVQAHVLSFKLFSTPRGWQPPLGKTIRKKGGRGILNSVSIGHASRLKCELRAELQLPSSGLLRFKYPDLFPSLSLPSTSTLQTFSPEATAISPQNQTAWSPAAWQGSPSTSSQLTNPDAVLEAEEERS
ncbi:hypothetical protein ACJZ2D_013696 [Fusarium nematophilum]